MQPGPRAVLRADPHTVSSTQQKTYSPNKRNKQAMTITTAGFWILAKGDWIFSNSLALV